MRCSGLEYKLFDCSHGALEVSNCDHSKDAGVICAEGSVIVLIRAVDAMIYIYIFQAVHREKLDL